MTSSPLPVTLTFPLGGSRRRLRFIRTCGCCMIAGCVVLMVPGSLLIVLGTRDSTGESYVSRPGIVLMAASLVGMATGCLMYCCVRKYREKHIAETILMKRQSTYSVASARSSVRSHRSDPSQGQRSRSHSPDSRSGSYCRQASQESRRSVTSFRQSSVESSYRSLGSVRQSSVESTRRSTQSIRQSSVESSRRSLSSMKQSSMDAEVSRPKSPFRQSSFDLHPPSEKRKVPYRQASCDLYPLEDDRLMPIRQIGREGVSMGHKKPHRQLSIDLHSPKRPRPIRQPSMDLGHSPPPSSPKRKNSSQVHITVEQTSRRSSLASLITQRISSHSDKHLKRRFMVPQYHSLDLPSIQLADFSDSSQEKSATPRQSVTSPMTTSLLVPSTDSLPTPSCDSAAVHERRSSQGLLEVPKEQYLTVPSPHRRFSR